MKISWTQVGLKHLCSISELKWMYGKPDQQDSANKDDVQRFNAEKNSFAHRNKAGHFIRTRSKIKTPTYVTKMSFRIVALKISPWAPRGPKTTRRSQDHSKAQNVRETTPQIPFWEAFLEHAGPKSNQKATQNIYRKIMIHVEIHV